MPDTLEDHRPAEPRERSVRRESDLQRVPPTRTDSPADVRDDSRDLMTLVVDKKRLAADPSERDSDTLDESLAKTSAAERLDDVDIMLADADGSRCGFIPGYSVIGRLGQGGMSVVFQAVHEKLQRIVALKVLTPTQCLEPESVERFKREAMAVARLNHSNIVTAYDYGEAEGRFFLALEYIEGMNCAELIESEGRLAVDRALLIVRDAILGLSHALGLGVIHRDVKPANLMFSEGGILDASREDSYGQVKVTDLGLAVMEESAQGASSDGGCIAGTPSFMAPEQARGDSVDFRADIYSLGATLYQMLTGVRPFEADTAVESIKMKLRERLVHPCDLRPGLNPGVARVLDRMMALSSRDRYQTYEELLDEIEALLEGRWARTPDLDPRQSSFHPPTLGALVTVDAEPNASIYNVRTEKVAIGLVPSAFRSRPVQIALALAFGCGLLAGIWIG